MYLLFLQIRQSADTKRFEFIIIIIKLIVKILKYQQEKV